MTTEELRAALKDAQEALCVLVDWPAYPPTYLSPMRTLGIEQASDIARWAEQQLEQRRER